MIVKGHKSYVTGTLNGVGYADFKKLYETQRPFSLMEQPMRDEAIKSDWDIIQAVLKPEKQLKAIKAEIKEQAPE